MTENEIGEAIIGAAMKVHSALGPGLLESAYGLCLLTRSGEEDSLLADRLGDFKLGYLLNFNVADMRDGVARIKWALIRAGSLCILRVLCVVLCVLRVHLLARAVPLAIVM